jgi:hypothetical protein
MCRVLSVGQRTYPTPQAADAPPQHRHPCRAIPIGRPAGIRGKQDSRLMPLPGSLLAQEERTVMRPAPSGVRYDMENPHGSSPRDSDDVPPDALRILPRLMVIVRFAG